MPEGNLLFGDEMESRLESPVNNAQGRDISPNNEFDNAPATEAVSEVKSIQTAPADAGELRKKDESAAKPRQASGRKRSAAETLLAKRAAAAGGAPSDGEMKEQAESARKAASKDVESPEKPAAVIPDNIHAQIAFIQSELKVPKIKVNDSGEKSFNYRTVNDIQVALAPILRKVGCYMLFHTELRETASGTLYCHAVVEVVNLRGESVKSYGYAVEPETLRDMFRPQISGTTETYARKQALCNLFNIDDAKDIDSFDRSGNADGAEKQTTEQAAPQKVILSKSNPQVWLQEVMHVEKFNGSLEDLFGELETKYIIDADSKLLLEAYYTGSHKPKGLGQQTQAS